jgi:uncharacterized protein (DUF1778 family)
MRSPWVSSNTVAVYGIKPYTWLDDGGVSMSTVRSVSKTDRLEARIPGDLKALLVRAASLEGRSLTDFIVAAASDAARRIIRESEILELSERDQVAFAEALLNPPGASPALQQAARRYRGEPA